MNNTYILLLLDGPQLHSQSLSAYVAKHFTYSYFPWLVFLLIPRVMMQLVLFRRDARIICAEAYIEIAEYASYLMNFDATYLYISTLIHLNLYNGHVILQQRCTVVDSFL